MIDITSIGQDLVLIDSQVPKAGNILSTQLGSLEYLPDFGVDLKYFLDENFQFQNESFKAYLVQVLAENSINVASVLETIEALYQKYTFILSPSETDGSLVR